MPEMSIIKREVSGAAVSCLCKSDSRKLEAPRLAAAFFMGSMLLSPIALASAWDSEKSFPIISADISAASKWSSLSVPPVPVMALSPESAQQEIISDTGDWDSYMAKLKPSIKGDNLFDALTDRLDLLVDGKEVMDSVAMDVRNARSFIHIEIYQWNADDIGSKFRDLLAEKVKTGVHVRVVLDSCGSGLVKPGSPEHAFVNSMIKDGIETKVRGFQLLHLDHRKLMVMDDGNGSLIGYTGGMNIGNEYQLIWHDQQTRIVGPAVERLHKSFLEDWKKMTSESLSGFPLAVAVNAGARSYVITHRGGDCDHNIKNAYLQAISTARRLIRIEDPYFTDDDIITALVHAAQARKGLKIQLVVPAKDDEQVTLHAFRSHYPELLKAGVELYEYQPRMEHMKVAVMDHFWSTIGSSNLDSQSLKYNDELNLLVLDRNFADAMDRRIFDIDIALSKRITSYTPSLADNIDGHLPFLLPAPQAN